MKRKENKILTLTYEEKKKCRFVCINQNYRLFECVVHKDDKKILSHGLRLHPPHLWQVKDGIVYKSIDNKLVAWYDLEDDK